MPFLPWRFSAWSKTGRLRPRFEVLECVAHLRRRFGSQLLPRSDKKRRASSFSFRFDVPI